MRFVCEWNITMLSYTVCQSFGFHFINRLTLIINPRTSDQMHTSGIKKWPKFACQLVYYMRIKSVHSNDSNEGYSMVEFKWQTVMS